MLVVFPLIEGMAGVATIASSGYREASTLLCAFHSLSRGRFDSPVVGVQDRRFPSELYCEVGGTGALLPGEEPLSIPLQAFHWEVCALVLPATCCMD